MTKPGFQKNYYHRIRQTTPKWANIVTENHFDSADFASYDRWRLNFDSK